MLACRSTKIQAFREYVLKVFFFFFPPLKIQSNHGFVKIADSRKPFHSGKKAAPGVFNLLTVISCRSTGNTREARKFMVGFNTRRVSFESLRLFHERNIEATDFHPSFQLPRLKTDTTRTRSLSIFLPFHQIHK